MKRKYLYTAIGLLLIIGFIASEGLNAFQKTAEHLKEDFAELGVHVFIAGWIFLGYGLYKIYKAEHIKRKEVA